MSVKKLNREKPKKKNGRPKAPISEKQLGALCRMKPSLKDAAAFFNVSEETIAQRCKEYGAEGFLDFRERHIVHTRHDLVRKAIKMAKNGNVPMLQFSLKNIANWKDRTDVTSGDEKVTFIQAVTDLERAVDNLPKKSDDIEEST